MMMYRRRATERRENGRGWVPLSLCSRQRKEEFKYNKKGEKKGSCSLYMLRRNTRYDSPGEGAIFHSPFAVSDCRGKYAFPPGLFPRPSCDPTILRAKNYEINFDDTSRPRT